MRGGVPQASGANRWTLSKGSEGFESCPTKCIRCRFDNDYPANRQLLMRTTRFVAVSPVTIACERLNAAGQAVVQRALLRFVESGEHLALDFRGGP